MPDYDLTGLSTRSFEQMIQAIACCALGPGITVFGDGPDGGREATFNGKLSNFPTQHECWDGYIVIQAKFLQRPINNSTDAKWAEKQLKKELNDFIKKGRKKPQYYIFATNVVLSAVEEIGWKDKLDRLIKSFKKALGLKDYVLWDHDQICRFLDKYEDVRHAYQAWITPGDVLAQIISQTQMKSSFSEIMCNFLQKEMINDQYSKLEQAGYSAERARVSLENVFIDLPAFKERVSKPPHEKKAELLPGFLRELLETGTICMRNEYISKQNLKSIPVENSTIEPGRYALIGGPGQGKSTITQFLCQIHRASLLINSTSGIDPEAIEIISQIQKRCETESLPFRLARRYPFRIELARFAKSLALAEKGVNSILSYIASTITSTTDNTVSPDQLRKWLRTYPWLIILDGLDEVPSSSNRDETMKAVQNFMIDISTYNADVLILATTRPQGYNDEFSPKRFHHRWLAPLSTSRALHYGKNLIESTHTGQRKNDIISRLNKAVENTPVARLMESPLQVTIMTRLLAEVADPPQERYKLFKQYYEVIYKREMERDVQDLSQLLRDHKANIDTIHHRTGLLLQLKSERARQTDATISIDDEFKSIVSERLESEGYSEEKLAHLIKKIAACVTDRLVFLVPSQSGRVGFEIRSLQEFMAAEALMDDPDNIVVNRIKTIASVPFWRNVVLFAAGKCYSERQWLRDNIFGICPQLNDDPNDNLARQTLSGARIALDLLEDGAARQQPAKLLPLARQALRLLELPQETVHKRLADVFIPEFINVYDEELRKQLGQSERVHHLSAWLLISRLYSEKTIAIDSMWADKIVDRFWPKKASEALYEFFNTSDFNKWILQKYSDVMFEMAPVPKLLHGQFMPSNNKIAAAAFKLHQGIGLHSQICLKLQKGSIIFFFTPIRKAAESLNELSSLELNKLHPFWRTHAAGAIFAKNPSAKSLANAIRSIANLNFDVKSSFFYYLPWPFLACIELCKTSQDFFDLADKAESGAFGEIEDWLAAEKRWEQKGITQDDIMEMRDDAFPIPHNIKQVGFPLFQMYFQNKVPNVKDVLDFYDILPGNKIKSKFMDILSYISLELLSKCSKKSIQGEWARFLEISRGTSRLPFIEQYQLLLFYKSLNHSKEIFFEWLDLHEKQNIFLGRRFGNPLTDEESFNDFIFALCERVQKKPEGGSLNVLARIALESALEKIPESILEIKQNDPRFRSAILIQLAKQNLSGAALLEIAKKISVLNETEGFISEILECFENNQVRNPEAVSFLESLLNTLPISYYHARGRIIGLFNELLSRREAPLSDPIVWKSLSLPPRLLQLI